MHIYAFGSVTRGEVTPDSDVDLLALVDKDEGNFVHDAYSVYTYDRILELWREGNPFSWHLHCESKLVFSSDNANFLENIGCPNEYSSYDSDFNKFYRLMHESIKELNNSTNSVVFELSNLFLAIRNISICYTLEHYAKPIFSRHAALMLNDQSIALPKEVYQILERARILCTRGRGDNLSEHEVSLVRPHFPYMLSWANRLK